jgi:hypothetical protein
METTLRVAVWAGAVAAAAIVTAVVFGVLLN